MYWTGRVVDAQPLEWWNGRSDALETGRGKVVRVVDWAAGWLWCRSLGGSFGWVPAASVALCEEPSSR